jgi:L-ascorbate metabolism protein UlaG (beta-lactamase superfamily)
MTVALSAWVGALAAGCGNQPNVNVDPEGLRAPDPGTITFWGHSAVRLETDGVTLVTDPVFTEGYSPWHRRIAPAPNPSAYDDTDLILISHAHRDHLNRTTLATFPRTAVVLCAEPTALEIEDLGFPIKMMRPWEAYGFEHVTVIAVPALHPGGKNSMSAAADGRALGFIIRTTDWTVYYTGDTEYFEGLRRIGEAFAPDLVLANVNAHLNEHYARRAFQELGTPPVAAIHHGSYGWTNEARAPRWHGELERLFGPMFIPLFVGSSLPLDCLDQPHGAAAACLHAAVEANRPESAPTP